jgi:hypothetical protein
MAARSPSRNLCTGANRVTNQATGATKADIGREAIVNGYAKRGEILDVDANIVLVKFPDGSRATTGQSNVIVTARTKGGDE